MALGQDAPQLRQRIVHMKYLVAQDLVENGASRRIVLENFAIDSEAAGGGLFRQMQEREQHVIASVHAEIVDTVPAGSQPVGLKAGLRAGWQREARLSGQL